MRERTCSRKGCDTFMCSTYVDDIGYICLKCQSEFKICLDQLPYKTKTDEEIKECLSTFMLTEKGSYDTEKLTIVDEFFVKHTKTE